MSEVKKIQVNVNNIIVKKTTKIITGSKLYFFLVNNKNFYTAATFHKVNGQWLGNFRISEGKYSPSLPLEQLKIWLSEHIGIETFLDGSEYYNFVVE